MADASVATTSGRNGLGGDETDGGIVIERHDDNAVSCRWTLPGFSQLSKQRTSTGWLAVGAGQDCRLLIYPGGQSLFLVKLPACFENIRNRFLTDKHQIFVNSDWVPWLLAKSQDSVHTGSTPC